MKTELDKTDYPPSARLLFWLSRQSGVGVHELYSIRAVRWLMTILDWLGRKPRD